MVQVDTSTTMLRELGADSRHARWAEFVERYRPMMEAYMKAHFPDLDADDPIEETFIALVDVLKNYRYSPDETGLFRNYLTGILRRKALRALRAAERQSRIASAMIEEGAKEEPDDGPWRDALCEIAMKQFFDDDTVQARTKEIFRRIAVNHEEPARVADSLQIPVNTVNKAKSRAVGHLRETVKALMDAAG